MKYENRVELHCHSKYGGNAMMHAGEIILAADKLSIPAIAITDTSSIMAFPEIESVCKYGKYVTRPVYGMEAIVVDDTSNKHRITVLVADETGKDTVYKILTDCDVKEAFPVFDEKDFFYNRNGLLIGSGTFESELYEKLFAGASDIELRAIIEKYDYVELLPGELYREANVRLVNICEEMNKSAVAVGDVHYLDNDGAEAWKVFCNWNRMDSVADYHLYSTEEMLAAFDYLGADKAYEIVVNNSNFIAEKCSMFSIVPPERQYPDNAGAREILAEKCKVILADKDDTTCQQSEWIDSELEALSNNNIEFIPLLVSNVLRKAKLKASDISLRGTSAGSMITYLLGISEVDPIKYNLPLEFIYGYDRTRELDLDINIPAEQLTNVFKLFGDESGIEKCVRLGTCHAISDNLAKAMIERYEQDNEMYFPEEKRGKICWKLVGNYVGRGKHPGGILLLAEGKDNDMPLLKTAEGMEITYYEYHFLDSQYLKLDLLPHNTINMLSEMSHITGIDLADVPYDDKEVLKLFKPDSSGEYSECADLPEFSSAYVQSMMKILKPETFDELVKISLLSHGTDCWLGNGEVLVTEGVTDIHGIIAGREDVFEYLCAHGIDRKLAFNVADSVRKGIIKRGRKVNWNEWKVELRKHGVPEWYLSSCEKIGYLFPRAHAISYLYMTMRMGWFKINYPEVYHKVRSEHEARQQ